MTVILNRVRRGFYMDSAALMRLSQTLGARPGIVQAALMIGSPSNKRLMADAGWGKGSDGNYMSATGTPFTVEVRSTDFVADLKESGAVRVATEGKAKGCWVMDLPDAAESEDEGAKIIVRSNGTGTYVGKDIAYQLWKVGLLDQDFQYEPFDADNDVWVTT